MDLTLGALVERIGALTGGPPLGALPPTLAGPLGALRAGATGMVGLEHALPVSPTAYDVIAWVGSRTLAEQCARMQAYCARPDDAAWWRALAEAGAAVAGLATHDALPHHYWLEFDRLAVRDAPNVFLSRDHPAADPAADPFPAALRRFEDALGSEAPRSATPYARLAPALPPAGCIRHVGYMLARAGSGPRLVVSEVTIAEVPRVLRALGDAVSPALLAAVVQGIQAGRLSGYTFMHLDWQDDRVIRVGLESYPWRVGMPDAPAPDFADVRARLAAAGADAAWLDDALRGGGAYTRIDGAWLAVTRWLNHVKLSVSAESPEPRFKAYLRYDWVPAARAVVPG